MSEYDKGHNEQGWLMDFRTFHDNISASDASDYKKMLRNIIFEDALKTENDEGECLHWHHLTMLILGGATVDPFNIQAHIPSKHLVIHIAWALLFLDYVPIVLACGLLLGKKEAPSLETLKTYLNEIKSLINLTKISFHERSITEN